MRLTVNIFAGAKDVPAEFDNSVMMLLKDFAKNEKRELRAFQPPLFE